MVYNIITLPIIIIFTGNGFGQLYYAIKLNRKFPNEHNFFNSIVVFLLWMLAGFLYPIFYVRDNFNIRWFETLSMTIICIYAPLLIFFILFYQYQFVLKKNPKHKQNRNMEFFLKNFKVNDEIGSKTTHSFNTDLHRKLFHLLPAILIIFLWLFAVHIWEGIWNADQFWGISGQEYGIFLILTVGYTAILIFAALDYVRLSYIFEKRNVFHLLPQCISNLLIKTLKRKENFEFTKPVALILSLIPVFFFFPFSIFTASALIASLGDGAASILGIKFGKLNFPRKSSKTIIGYISGFLVSFGVSILALWVFEPLMEFIKIVFIALGGAITFFIIDLVSLKIDDNILNPIFCSLIMIFLYIIL